METALGQNKLAQINFVKTRRQAFEYFGTAASTFEVFNAMLESCTEDNGCMVVDNTSHSDHLTDTFYWYRIENDDQNSEDENESDNDSENETAVGLLIDRSLLKFRPYLRPVHDDLDDSKLSSIEQKRRNHENKIRGGDKVVVNVLLRTLYGSRTGDRETGAVAQWVVAKHVLVKPKGMKPTKAERKQKGYTSQSLFIGDGNDSPTQQEENWRWNACRSVDPLLDDSDLQIRDDHQLFGEVVKIDILGAADGSDSLATVTVRRLLAPHQTKSTIFHRASELFD